MFYFGKSLQAASHGGSRSALLFGLREQSMTKELTMLGIGVVLFVLAGFRRDYGSGG